MLGELLSVCRRIFGLRPNFLKHSQNSHFDCNDPALIHTSTVRGFERELSGNRCMEQATVHTALWPHKGLLKSIFLQFSTISNFFAVNCCIMLTEMLRLDVSLVFFSCSVHTAL